jgi:hypothetical protein
MPDICDGVQDAVFSFLLLHCSNCLCQFTIENTVEEL